MCSHVCFGFDWIWPYTGATKPFDYQSSAPTTPICRRSTGGCRESASPFWSGATRTHALTEATARSVLVAPVKIKTEI